MSALLDFEAIVMKMSVEPAQETEQQMTPAQFEMQLSKKMDVGYMNAVANALNVSDEGSAKTALSMSLQARKLKQQIEESRKEIVKPHFDYQKAINKVVKDVEAKLEEIETNLRKKIEGWNSERKELPFENLISLELKVDDGQLYTQNKWDYTLEDSKAVPAEYLAVDEKKIKEAIANGIRNIPGVNIFQKEEIIMRVKN